MSEPSPRQRALAMMIEQAVSALVNDDEFVYFVFLMPREIDPHSMAWTHVSNAPFIEIGDVIQGAINEKLRHLLGKKPL